MANTADILIVGGGIIGMACALELQRRGLTVELFDRGELGQEASSAAAGFLAPYTESTGNAALDSFCVAGNAIWPDFIAALKEETGIDGELRWEGTMLLAFGEKEHDDLDRQADELRARGVECERLSREDVIRLEVTVNPAVKSGLLIPDERQVENRKVVLALRRALELRNVRLHSFTAVEGIARAGGGSWETLTSNGSFCSGSVLLAAGAWSANLAPEPSAKIPVVPVKGQIVCLQTEPVALNHCIIASRCYLVPRLDGRILIGSTMEDAGFDKRVTACATHELLGAAFELSPCLREAGFAEAWAGLRPDTADHLPILGAGMTEGLIYATGHFRNGILLAPATAKVVGALACGGPVFAGIDEFRPQRFGPTVGCD